MKLNRNSTVCDECGTAAKLDCECGQAGAIGKRHRRRIFSLSLGDWLDPEVPVEWLARMLDTIRQCPDVDWLLCTKRPELWRERLIALPIGQPTWIAEWLYGKTIPKNIVILASVENQQAADKRIPELLRIPAARRGLSCEPLLGPVDLKLIDVSTDPERNSAAWARRKEINWVIIGGESGHSARPCNVDWVRSLREQCKAAGVPCFVKQLGSYPVTDEFTPDGWPPGTYIEGHTPSQLARIRLNNPKGGDMNEWPLDLKVREFYKP